ncbi:MAG: OST-HTH/LOTUS domain-containing protein, partial [Microbacterium sp.]
APPAARSGGRRAKAASTPDTATPDAATPDAAPEEVVATEAPADVEASLNAALLAAAPPRRTNRRVSSKSLAAKAEGAPDEPEPLAAEEPVEDPQDTATRLLERALRLGHDKNDDSEWLHSSAVKTHMRRMDPSFSEKALGYRSFNDFVKARESIAELEESGHERLVRLRE